MVWLQQEPSNSKQAQVWTVWKQLDVVGHGLRTVGAAVDLCGCKTTKAIKLATVLPHQFKYLDIVNLIPQDHSSYKSIIYWERRVLTKLSRPPSLCHQCTPAVSALSCSILLGLINTCGIPPRTSKNILSWTLQHATLLGSTPVERSLLFCLGQI